MQKYNWKELYSTLKITPESGPQYCPNSDTLDRFEQQYNVRLPESYRSFAALFGPGLLGNTFRIAVPGTPFSWVWYDLNLLNQQSARHCPIDYLEKVQLSKVQKQEIPVEIERIRRMIFFCSVESEEYIGWDPKDVRNSKANEYGVYILPGLGRPVFCASTFAEFVLEICLGDQWPKYHYVDRESWMEDDRQTFIPIIG
jgi:hypothetical protein